MWAYVRLKGEESGFTAKLSRETVLGIDMIRIDHAGGRGPRYVAPDAVQGITPTPAPSWAAEAVEFYETPSDPLPRVFFPASDDFDPATTTRSPRRA